MDMPRLAKNKDRGAICLLLCAWFLLFSAFPANAASKQTMVYDVYASGIHVLDAQVEIDTSQKGRYSVLMQARTRGFLASLVPWEGTFESTGWAEGQGRYIPEIHRSTATEKKDTEFKEYRYTRAGGFKDLTIVEKGKTKKEKSEPELTKGTTDALSAALEVLDKVGRGGECAGAADVYDGKRRFTQVFTQQSVDTLIASRYNRFAGAAVKCTVEVVPKGGAWHKKPRGWMSIQEQGRAHGALPTLWTAKLNKDGPAIPVKIMIKTGYGTLFMHLAKYSDGDKMAAEKKKK